MPPLDRTEILHRLDARHDQLLAELDNLNEQIEAALQSHLPRPIDEAIAENA
ncbi:MAG: hypothetical protein KDA61_02160 [Planctomycetales bacterium]|nr:hypothetical protein [Planctomycetales bacterium]